MFKAGSGLEERLEFMENQELELVNVPRKLQQIVELENAFWKRWSQDGFSLFCPLKKWTVSQRNLKIGDIVLIKYEKNFGKDKFRMGKVVQAKEDDMGRVRTVTVAVRNKRRV